MHIEEEGGKNRRAAIFIFSLLLRFIDRRVVNAAVIVIISYCDRNHEDWWASREFDV